VQTHLESNPRHNCQRLCPLWDLAMNWWQWLLVGLAIWVALILLLVAFFYTAGER